MLAVRNLSINRANRTIVSNLSLTVQRGASLALTGPSGSGKTTVIKAIAGFVDKVCSGKISFAGSVWQDQQNSVPARGRSAAMMFQECAVWPHLSVKQQLSLVNPEDCDALISRLSLNPNTLGRDLSGGEKQRLALGRVLRTNAPLLLLDEPFAALDHDAKSHMVELLVQHQEKTKCAILLSTHDALDPVALGAMRFALVQ